jgi:hypothetical protein
MIKDKTFDEILKKIIQEEKDGTFPPRRKNKGVLLPGLSNVMADLGVSDGEVAAFTHLSERSIRHYRQQTRGAQGMWRILRIARALECSLEDLTSSEELESYHHPLNSRTNRVTTSSLIDYETLPPHNGKTKWSARWRQLSKKVFG